MQNRQHLEAQKLAMLSQHLWPHHETPPSITSFQTQTLLHLILFLARVCEQSERYEDMLEHVNSLVTMGTDLS